MAPYSPSTAWEWAQGKGKGALTLLSQGGHIQLPERENKMEPDHERSWETLEALGLTFLPPALPPFTFGTG